MSDRFTEATEAINRYANIMFIDERHKQKVLRGITDILRETLGDEATEEYVFAVEKRCCDMSARLVSAEKEKATLEAENAKLQEALDKANNYRVFANDPFRTVAEAFNELFPNMPWPCIQWTEPGDIHKDDNSPWGHADFPTEEGDEEIFVNIDSILPAHAAVEILAHELAHVACHHLGLDQGEDKHGKNWEDTFDAINKKYYEKAILAAKGEE